MANRSLPMPQVGRSVDETINNLIDTMMIYRKDLNFLMKNLSFENMPIVAEFANRVEEDFIGLEGGLVSLGTEIAQTSREIRLIAYRTEEAPGVHKGASPPESPEIDDLWLKNTVSPSLLCMYDGQEWVLIGEDVDNLYDSLVGKDKIISAIIASPEEIKISSGKISLEGLTTVNSRFQVLLDGSIKATNANISGKISASSGDIGGFGIDSVSLYGYGNNRIELKSSNISSYYDNVLRVRMDYNQIDFYGEGSEKIGSIQGTSSKETMEIKTSHSGRNIDIDSARYIWLHARGDNYRIRSNGNFEPEPDNSRSLGRSDRRWRYIYLANQPNVDSDMRKKEFIQEIPELLVERLMEIEPMMFWQGDKWHFGYIAQDVQRVLYQFALEEVGFEEAVEYMESFAFLHRDESYLSLLYGELAVLKDKEYREKVKELENRLNELEGGNDS